MRETQHKQLVQSHLSRLVSSRLVSPALSAERITAHVGGHDARTRAVADLAANNRVAAERLGLTLGALGSQRPRWADTVTGHRLAQPRATVTGWSEETMSYREREF